MLPRCQEVAGSTEVGCLDWLIATWRSAPGVSRMTSIVVGSSENLVDMGGQCSTVELMCALMCAHVYHILWTVAN